MCSLACRECGLCIASHTLQLEKPSDRDERVAGLGWHFPTQSDLAIYYTRKPIYDKLRASEEPEVILEFLRGKELAVKAMSAMQSNQAGPKTFHQSGQIESKRYTRRTVNPQP